VTERAMVIVGAGKAGARAVVGLREHGWTGPIVLIGDETRAPYDRPPLSKAAITDEAEPEPVYLLDEGMLKSLKADWRGGSAAASIDRANKVVTLANGEAIPYDKLLIATGAKARRLSIRGAQRVLLLRDFPDAEKLRREFTPGRNIAIIGGGFIGLELAASANKRGCNVAVIEMQPRVLMRGVPQVISDVVTARHHAAGVTIHTSAGIDDINGEAVVLSDGRKIPADIVIAGIGAAPEVALAKEAGLAMDNGIACDDRMQTSDPDIYASGDCCSFPHPVFGGRRMRLEAWRSAQDQAAVAAENMLGGNKRFEAVPWFWSDQYELTLQIAGDPSEGTRTVTRIVKDGAFIVFHLRDDGTLAGASGIGPGNSIARDIRLAEMLIGKRATPDPAALADATVQMKALLKG
jgi:3-phenylpropionate/trans-cinnamate dioxygenase ferredoxin reductase subunit